MIIIAGYIIGPNYILYSTKIYSPKISLSLELSVK